MLGDGYHWNGGELGHLSFRDLVLSRDRRLVAAFNARNAAPHQLRSAQLGEHDELELAHAFRKLDHREPPMAGEAT